MTLRKAEKGISEIRRNSCCTEQIKPSGDEAEINKTNDLRNLPLLSSQRNTQLPGTQHYTVEMRCNIRYSAPSCLPEGHEWGSQAALLWLETIRHETETTAERRATRPADTPGYKVTMQQGSARQQTTGRDVKHWPVSDANCQDRTSGIPWGRGLILMKRINTASGQRWWPLEELFLTTEHLSNSSTKLSSRAGWGSGPRGVTLTLTGLALPFVEARGSKGLICCSFWARTTWILGTKEAGGLWPLFLSRVRVHPSGPAAKRRPCRETTEPAQRRRCTHIKVNIRLWKWHGNSSRGQFHPDFSWEQKMLLLFVNCYMTDFRLPTHVVSW